MTQEQGLGASSQSEDRATRQSPSLVSQSRPDGQVSHCAPTPIWSCKIGTRGDVRLPSGSDLPMRRAAQEAFHQITGLDAEFVFSGWSADLTEPELAVVENRLPSDEHCRETCVRDAAQALYEALVEIAKGAGPFNRDPLIHAENTIESMKEIAEAALAKARGGQ